MFLIKKQAETDTYDPADKIFFCTYYNHSFHLDIACR